MSPEDFPLLRHLYEVVALERPVDIPWSSFFGGEPGHDRDHDTRAGHAGWGDRQP